MRILVAASCQDWCLVCLACPLQVLLVTVPPSTEQPHHPANARITRMVTFSKQLAAAYPQVQLIDFNATCTACLESHSSSWQLAAAAAAAAAAGTNLPIQEQPLYEFSMASGGWLMGTVQCCCITSCAGPGRPSAGPGALHLLTDQVHMNDTAAVLLAEQLELPVQRLRAGYQQQQEELEQQPQ